MKARRAIPLPRRLAREKGRAGVDRPPIRLYRTGPKFCPRHAFWVGEGSEFANPFLAQTPEMQNALRAFELFIRSDRRPQWNPVVNKHEMPRARPEQLANAAAVLFREWMSGDVWNDRGQPARFGSVRIALEQITFPPPFEVARIRELLRGRDLVDSTPDRWMSHADELLRIANSTGEQP